MATKSRLIFETFMKSGYPEKIKAFYDAGYSKKEIFEKLNISEAIVESVCKNLKRN